ncbi:MCE family protein [Nocardia higoensis]|uniref:MCE family protein n=1 Tax=Nocardia higoensis TaxID=228599 RepID=UPI0002E653C1|nr:MlaD family protein [Nocardia higoensis]
MLSTTIRVQLSIFAVVAVLAVAFSAVKYAGVQRYTQIGTYIVRAEFADAAGLYVNALVTYRGVDIGVVNGLSLGPSGAVAELQIGSDHRVPADSEAILRSVSAVGEQYVDLVPRTSTEPFLADGDTLGPDRTRVPIPTATVVAEINSLLQTVPTDSLRTTVDETSAALGGTGDALNRALAASAALVQNARSHLGQTVALVTTVEPVLQALSDSGPAIQSAATDLASFTDQLVMNDEQLRAVVTDGPRFFDSATGTLQQITPTLPLLLMNLQTSGEVLRVNAPGLRHLLVVYPALSSAVNYMHRGFQDPGDRLSGQGPLDVKLLNTGNPMTCTEGYQETQRRDPSETGYAPAPADAYCKLPQTDSRVARGARNLPCATDPSVRTADIANCPGGPPSQWPQMLARPGQQPVPIAPPTPDPQQPPPAEPASAFEPLFTAPYEPITGRFHTADGAAYTVHTLAPSGAANPKEPAWHALFLK